MSASTPATSASATTIEVRSPWDDSVVGEVRSFGAEDVTREVGIAAGALGSLPPAHERAAVLDRAVELLGERAERFATSMRDEAGKPIRIARAEVERALDTLRFSAVEARSLAGTAVPLDAAAPGAGLLGFTERRPVGVVAAITPFNFPLNLCCHKIGPAIAAGCPVVHKPASATPLTAQLLHELVLDAGLPEERYRLVPGAGAEVGGALLGDECVRHVSFTGSGTVGWGLLRRAARAHVSLELGNATPLIAFADADLDAVARAVAQHGYSFAGQSCVSVQRVLVERTAYDEVVDRVTQTVGDVAFGDPAFDEVTCGPLIDSGARDSVLAAITSATGAGARLTIGGEHDGNVVAPTVLADVDPAHPVSCEEVFGPVVALTPFDDEADALRIANGTRYGLQAAVWTSDLDRALRVARALEFGGAFVNEAPTYRVDLQPYGGVKDSGNAKEGPHWAVRDMTVEHLIAIRTGPT